MSNTYPIAWTQADEFLGAGGTTVYIKNPTEADITPYVVGLTGEEQWVQVASHGLSESIKDFYPNPQLRIALDNNNNICGIVFYYEVLDQGNPFLWIEAWADNEVTESASLLMYLTCNQAAQVGQSVCGNPRVETQPAFEKRPYIGKNPETKWYTVTAEELIALCKANKDEALATQYFSKIMQDSLAWVEPVTPTP